MEGTEKLSDNARVWVFAVNDLLSDKQVEQLSKQLQNFTSSWMSHETKVTGGFDIRYNKFIIVAANENTEKVSGCSIDNLFQNVSQITEALGVKLADRANIFFKKSEQVIDTTREKFERLSKEGDFDNSTIVFDNSILRLKDYRNQRWELAFNQSWHAQAFPLEETTM